MLYQQYKLLRVMIMEKKSVRVLLTVTVCLVGILLIAVVLLVGKSMGLFKSADNSNTTRQPTIIAENNMSENQSNTKYIIIDEEIYSNKPNNQNGNTTIIKPAQNAGPVTTKKQTETVASWQDAAVDLICNAPDYGLSIDDVFMSVELIDATGDHIPEIFFGTYMGFYQIPTITGYFYYNGSKYVKGTMSEHQGTYPIEPHTNSSGQPILLTTTKGDNDFSSVMPDYSSYWYTGVYIYQLNCSGSTANFTEVANFEEYRNELIGFAPHEKTEEEIQHAEERWEEFRQEAMQFNMSHPIVMYYNYVVSEPVYLDTCSAEGYKAAFSEKISQSLVEQYATYY